RQHWPYLSAVSDGKNVNIGPQLKNARHNNAVNSIGSLPKTGNAANAIPQITKSITIAFSRPILSDMIPQTTRPTPLAIAYNETASNTTLPAIPYTFATGLTEAVKNI